MLKRAREIYDSQNFKPEMANSIFRLGIIHWREHDYENALEFYDQALNIYKESKDQRAIAKMHRYKGIVYNRIGEFAKALEQYFQSLENYQALHDEVLVAEVLGNIGSLQSKLGNYEGALDSYSRSLEMFKQLGYKRAIGFRTHNLGTIYYAMEDYDKAKSFYNRALDIFSELQFSIGVAEVKIDLGILYWALGENAKSLDYLNQARQIFEDKKYLSGLVEVYRYLTLNYESLDQHQKALEYASRALKLLEKTRNPDDLLKIYREMSSIYSKINDYQHAYQYFRKYHSLSDSLLNLQTKERIAEIETKYETARREQEIQNLKNEKKIEKQRFQRNFFIVTLILLILVVALIFSSYQAKRKHVEVLKKKNKELEIARDKAVEADRLKSTFLANMSHEIRTPMNAIVGFSELLEDSEIKGKERKELLEQVKQNSMVLLRLIDDLIDFAKIESGELKIINEKVSLNHLFHQVYGTIKNNYHDKLEQINFELSIPEEDMVIETDSKRLHQILYNLLDNSFKFTDEGFVLLGYTQSSDDNPPRHLILFVKDSGIGIPPEQQQEIFKRFSKIKQNKNKYYRGTGLGLAIIDHIVRKMGGKIELDSKINEGSAFYVYLPLAR
jgi:signal transduction histidine kinase